MVNTKTMIKHIYIYFEMVALVLRVGKEQNTVTVTASPPSRGRDQRTFAS